MHLQLFEAYNNMNKIAGSISYNKHKIANTLFARICEYENLVKKSIERINKITKNKIKIKQLHKQPNLLNIFSNLKVSQRHRK